MTINPYESPRDNDGASPIGGSAPLRATYNLDYRTLHLALRMYVRRHRGVRYLLWGGSAIVQVVVIGGFILDVTSGDSIRSALPLLVVGTLLAAALSSPAASYVFASIVLLAVGARHGKGVLGEHSVEVANGELTESTRVNRTTWQLGCLLSVWCSSHAIVVSLPGGAFLAIAGTGDFGTDTFETFGQRLTEAVRVARPI